MTIDTILFAACYTALMVPVGIVYYFEGKSSGITETLELIHRIDPDFISRMSPKLKEYISANTK